jgi:hypothetical protein
VPAAAAAAARWTFVRRRRFGVMAKDDDGNDEDVTKDALADVTDAKQAIAQHTVMQSLVNFIVDGGEIATAEGLPLLLWGFFGWSVFVMKIDEVKQKHHFTYIIIIIITHGFGDPLARSLFAARWPCVLGLDTYFFDVLSIVRDKK